MPQGATRQSLALPDEPVDHWHHTDNIVCLIYTFLSPDVEPASTTKFPMFEEGLEQTLPNRRKQSSRLTFESCPVGFNGESHIMTAPSVEELLVLSLGASQDGLHSSRTPFSQEPCLLLLAKVMNMFLVR